MKPIKLFPKERYEEADLRAPIKYAVQSKANRDIVALFTDKDMAVAFVAIIDGNQLLYFRDGYELREVWEDR